MATITPTHQSTEFSLKDSNRQVRDPLQKLRGYIRRYVITQALTTLLISLAIWFWAILLLDFGSFYLLTFDWVQSLPSWFRALLLGLALAGICFMVELRKVMKVHVERHKDSTEGFAGWVARALQKPWLVFGLASPLLLTYFAIWIFLGVQRGEGAIPSPLMGLIVAGLLIAFAAVIVIKRLLYEFRDPALALVLERRFPQLLGDRLITAVELNNPKLAESYGYSPVMVEQTIREAADRVGELDPAEVFNWRRLYWQGFIALLLTIGAYLFVGIGVSTAIYAKTDKVNAEGFSQFHDTSAILFERNVLLSDTRWPRKVHLEIVSPADAIHKIGEGESQDADSRKLVVRALKWVIADDAAEENWRALLWNDLTEDLAGVPVPEVTFPDAWTSGMRYPNGLSVDEVEINLATPAIRHLNPESRKVLMDFITALETRATESSMSRTMRRLEIPKEVVIKLRGEETSIVKPLSNRGGGLFTARIPELRDLEVTYNIHAADYISDTRTIITVPRPRLKKLIRDERHPAYFYYDADEQYLKGKEQLIRLIPISVENTSSTDIPFYRGSTVVLRAETTKDLKSDSVRVVAAKGSPPIRDSVAIHQEGPRGIVATISNVNSPIEFDCEFIDTDNVKGTHTIQIKLQVDKAPYSSKQAIIRAQPSRILRRVDDRYMITANALVPFNFDLLDDHGLSSVKYHYEMLQLRSSQDQARRAAMTAGGITMPVGANPWIVVPLAEYQQRLRGLLVEGQKKIKGDWNVQQLAELLRQQNDRYEANISQKRDEMEAKANANVELEKIYAELFRQRIEPKFSLIRNYKVWEPDNIQEPTPLGEYLNNPELDMFRLERSELKGFDLSIAEPLLKVIEGNSQPKYAMQLYVEAKDNNIERPDGKGRSQSNLYQFVIVEEPELLFEIGKEEQDLYDRFSNIITRIREGRDQFDKNLKLLTSGELESQEAKDKHYPFAAVSVETFLKEKFNDSVNDTILIYNNYYRIYQEMRTNRISQNHVDSRYKDVVEPLFRIQDEEYGISRKAINDYLKALQDETTSPAEKFQAVRNATEDVVATLDILLTELIKIQSKMKGITGLQELIDRLKSSIEAQRLIQELLAERKIILEKIILGEALEGLDIP